MDLTKRETAMILACLRFVQRTQFINRLEELDIATNYGEFDPLTDSEIDILCERLNTGEPECPECGEELSRDEETENFVCHKCGLEFDLK